MTDPRLGTLEEFACKLAENQEPLGEEFEEVWNDH